MTDQKLSPGRLDYMPALDGLRGVFVVLGPLLYHARPESIRGGPDILPGGILSLDLFFVLSSFLIVSIALREWDRTGRIDLIAYAGRRARRLLPALLTALLAVTLYLVLAGNPEIVPRWTGAIVSALTYSANWHEIAADVSYFEQFDNPSPLKHVWSFAIEEQFYVIAPLFVIVAMAWFGRHRRWILLSAAVGGALLSAVWMAHLYTPGTDPSRVYYGTDTRAQALFVGIAMAVVLHITGPPCSKTGRTILRTATYPTMVIYLWLITNVSHRNDWMFEQGGFLLVAVVSAVIIGGMTQTAGRDPLQRIFELGPIRYAGRISYGLYLYHWPIYLLVTGERAGALFGQPRIDGYQLLGVHLVLTFAAAIASYHLIERPVMERRWPALKRSITLPVGGFACATTVAMILAGLLIANSTRPVRIEQVFVPVAATESSDTTESAGGDTASSKPVDINGSADNGAASGGLLDDGGVSNDGGLSNDGGSSGELSQDGGVSNEGVVGDDGAVAAGNETTPHASGRSADQGDSTNGTDVIPPESAGASTYPFGNLDRPGGDLNNGGDSHRSDGLIDNGRNLNGRNPSGGTDNNGRNPSSGTGNTGGTGGDPGSQTAPIRVLVVGDSVSAQIGWALQEWSVENPGQIIVFNESHIGCGVVRGGLKLVPGDAEGPVGEVCSNWHVPVSFSEVADSEIVSWPTALEVFAPDAVIAHISPWDATDRIVPGVVEDWSSIGDPEYDNYVLSEYLAASEMLTSGGSILYWLKGSILNRELVSEDHAERIKGLNALVAEAAANQNALGRQVVMVDFPSFIGEINSDRELDIRDDGVHLSDQGVKEVAPWLVDVITQPR